MAPIIRIPEQHEIAQARDRGDYRNPVDMARQDSQKLYSTVSDISTRVREAAKKRAANIQRQQNRPHYTGKIQRQRQIAMARGEEAARSIDLGGAGRAKEAREMALEQAIAQSQGMSSEEAQAVRERGLRGIMSQEQAALRGLQGITARTGMRGPAAAALQQRALQDSMRAREGLEIDLAARDLELKRQGLRDLQGVTAYNVGLQNREQFAKQYLPMLYGQQGVTDYLSGERLRQGDTMIDIAGRNAYGEDYVNPNYNRFVNPNNNPFFIPDVESSPSSYVSKTPSYK